MPNKMPLDERRFFTTASGDRNRADDLGNTFSKARMEGLPDPARCVVAGDKDQNQIRQQLNNQNISGSFPQTGEGFCHEIHSDFLRWQSVIYCSVAIL